MSTHLHPELLCTNLSWCLSDCGDSCLVLRGAWAQHPNPPCFLPSLVVMEMEEKEGRMCDCRSSAFCLPRQNANHRVVYSPFGSNGVKIPQIDHPIAHHPPQSPLWRSSWCSVPYPLAVLPSPEAAHQANISPLAFSCLEGSDETSFFLSVAEEWEPLLCLSRILERMF